MREMGSTVLGAPLPGVGANMDLSIYEVGRLQGIADA